MDGRKVVMVSQHHKGWRFIPEWDVKLGTASEAPHLSCIWE